MSLYIREPPPKKKLIFPQKMLYEPTIPHHVNTFFFPVGGGFFGDSTLNVPHN